MVAVTCHDGGQFSVKQSRGGWIIGSIQRTETSPMNSINWCIQYLNEEIAPLV